MGEIKRGMEWNAINKIQKNWGKKVNLKNEQELYI